MKLLELYSLATGLKIRKQHMLGHFYALPFTRYITLHASSGMVAKNFPYWVDVIGLIKPYLDAQKIDIVQLGTKDDVAVAGCFHTMGKTSEFQANHIVENTLLHLGNDSVWSHRAGHLHKPLVTVFGPTSEENHGPMDFEPAKSRFISSHRWGKKPSFAAQENPMSIALIDPFLVARSVLDLLEIPHQIGNVTQYIGPMYGSPIIEIIPNTPVNPDFNPTVTAAVRMDIHHDENVLAQILQGRKCNVITKAPININLLTALKDQIQLYAHEIAIDCSPDYLRQVLKVLPKVTIFTRVKDEAELAALRFQFFDVVKIEQVLNKTREEFEKDCQTYLNDQQFVLDSAVKSGKLMFKAQKYVLSKEKIYLSLTQEKSDQPMNEASTVAPVIDDPLFWLDYHHYLFYLNP